MELKKDTLKQTNIHMVCTVIGAVLIFIPTSVSSFWGNVSVYVASYFLAESGSTADFLSSWIVSLSAVGVVLGLLISGRMTCWNQNWTLLVCIIISDVCFFIFYLASIYLLAPAIYVGVFISGVAIGLIDVVIFQNLSGNSKDCKGLLVSIACSGISLGPFIGNPLTTMYVNPDNLTPDSTVDGIKIFTQADITRKVPLMFLFVGITCLLCQLIGYALFVRIKLIKTSRPGHDDQLTDEPNVIYGALSSTCEQNVDVNSTLTQPKLQNEKRQRISENEENAGNVSSNDVIDNTEDFKPGQLLRHKTFYILCFVSACQMFSNLLSKNYYKTYGLLSISDDRFLSLLGAAMGVIGAVSLIIWGVVLDKINAKSSLIILYVSFVMFTLLMYFTPLVNKWLYFISVNMLAATYSCKYPTFVTVCIAYFGSTHFSSNFGLLSAARMVIGFAAPPVLDTLLAYFNWFAIFCWTASLTIVDIFLILYFVPRSKTK